MAGRLTLFMPGKTDAHFSWELLLVIGCTDFARHIPPNAVVAEGILENKMPSLRVPVGHAVAAVG